MDLIDSLINSPVAGVILILTIITSIRAFSNPDMLYRMTFSPYDISHRGEWYRIFSSGLIHMNWAHLAFNMLTFYFFAFPLEQIAGHLQLLIIYVGSLMISGMPSMIRYKGSSGYRALGASGAVSGVLFAIIIMFPTLPLNLLFIPIDIPAWLLGLVFLGYSFYASFYGKDRGGVRIGHDAHLWGALAGMVLMVLLKPEVAENFARWISGQFGS